MPAINHLALWESVEKTDPQFTKRVNQRGGFTAIGAQYQVREATNRFGAFGKGWGIRNEVFKELTNTKDLILYQAEFWYKLNDEESTFPIHSSIKIMMGSRVDDDFAKKVATDALTKGLSKLGFNADVFMGRFDDNKYVNQMIKKFGNGKESDTWREKVVSALETLDADDKVKVQTALEEGKITSNNWEATIERIEEMKSQTT